MRPSNRFPLWVVHASTAVCLAAVLATNGLASPGDTLATEGPGLNRAAAPAGESTAYEVALKTGAFTYSVPIAVPPGRLGMEPEVELSYSSQAALRGGLAAGWSLAFPDIHMDFSDGNAGQDASALTQEWVSTLHGGHVLVRVTEPGAPSAWISYRGENDSSFTRYTRNVSPSEPRWEARTPDGRVYRFGDPKHIDGAFDAERAVLTSVSDAHGNTVDYWWKRRDLDSGFFTIVLDKITYTANASAGLTHHAEVVFDWIDPTYCPGALLPVGAVWDYRGRTLQVDGALALSRVRTQARDSAAAPFRPVREARLRYQPGIGCNSGDTPTRVLTSVQESATSRDGVTTTMPETRFEYGSMVQPPTAKVTIPGLGQTIAWGGANVGDSPPTIYAKMIDLDGDGRLDRLTVSSDRACEAQWHRNIGGSFASPQTIALPQQLMWRNGVSATPAYRERCTLSGQESALQTPNLPKPKDGSVCPHKTAIVHYRWMDVTGDARPDLVTALQYSQFWFDPAQGGTPTRTAPSTTNHDCQFTRRWEQPSASEYTWRIYENLGNGTFSTTPSTRSVQLPLDAEGTDGFVGKTAERDQSIGRNESEYGIFDLDGDGILDLVESDYTEWRFAKGRPDATWLPWKTWPAPTGKFVSLTTTTWPGTRWVQHDVENTLEDVNGDGLPDLVASTPSGMVAYFNDGVSFDARGVQVIAFARPLSPGRIEIEATDGTNANVRAGVRHLLHRFIDMDGDGLSDFVRMGTGGDTTSVVHPNQGASLHLPYASAETPVREALFGKAFDDGRWSLGADVLDITGDGVPDEFVNGELRTRAVATPRLLLHRIANGRGGQLDVVYASSNDTRTVTEDGGRSPSPVWVVSQVTQSSGTDASATGTTTYRYRRPVYNEDLEGRFGFRGFASVTQVSPLGGTYQTVFQYDLPRPPWGNVLWDGLPVREEVRHADGRLEKVTSHEYDVVAIMHDHDLHAVVPSATEQQVIVPGTGPGTGNDSPRVRTTFVWSAMAPVGGSDDVIAYQSTVEETVVDPSGTLPTSAPRRTVTAPRLLYTETEYFLLVEDTRAEVLESGTWKLTGRRRAQFERGIPVVEDELIDEGGTSARTKRVLKATGVPEAVRRPNQVANEEAGEPFKDTKLEYDEFDLFPIKTTDELGGFAHRRFDVGTGELVVESGRTNAPSIDQAPRVLTRRDGFGRVLEVHRTREEASGALALSLIEKHEYTDGHPSSEVVLERLSYAPERWGKSTTIHDGWGRVTSEIDHSARGIETVSYRYGPMGNLVERIAPDASNDGADVVSVAYQHDSLGRIKSTAMPETGAVTYDYEGYVITEAVISTDGSEGRRLKTTHDPLGRMRIVAEWTGAIWATTFYNYDGNDNVRTIEDADGALTVLDHDLAGRRTRVVRGDKAWVYAYDLHGNLQREHEPTPPGRNPIDYVNTYGYDEIDRQTSIRPGAAALGGPGDDSALATHGAMLLTYDEGCVGAHGFGRLCRTSLPFGTVQYGYTVEGWERAQHRMLAVPGTVAVTESLTRKHDADGAPTQTVHIDASGKTTIEEHQDADGEPVAVDLIRDDEQPTRLATLTRGRAGVVRRRASGNGDEQVWGYDRIGRVRTMRVSNAADVQIVAHSLDFWQTGNLRSLTSSSLLAPLVFTYDAQDQLVKASDGGAGGYEARFDISPAGRIRRAAVTSALTGSAVVNRDVDYVRNLADLSAPTAALRSRADGSTMMALEHDHAGRLTRRTRAGSDVKFGYDTLDRLRVVVQSGSGGVIETYFYDHQGSRMAALTLAPDGTRQLRHWFGPAETLYTVDGSQLERDVHVGLAGLTIARASRSARGVIEYVYSDGLGNALVLTDEAGAEVARYAYGAFGELLVKTGAQADTYDRLFNGKEWDEASELSYYGFRYYDPVLLEWTQPDPMFRATPDADLRQPRLAALYTFSLNNPLRYVDPDGLQSADQAKSAGTFAALLQREMCTDSSTFPAFCPAGPSPLIHDIWQEEYGKQSVNAADEEAEPEAPKSGSLLAKFKDLAYELVVPQDALDVALLAVPWAKAALKTRKVAKGYRSAGKVARATGTAVKKLARHHHHHLFPQALRNRFKRLQIDVDDYTLRIPTSLHKKIHSKKRMAKIGKLDWNSRWEQELSRTGPDGKKLIRTKAQAMAKMEELRQEYRLPAGSLVRYPR